MTLYSPLVASEKKLVIKTEREKVLSFRVTPDEYAQIEARAKALGLRVTQYVRSLALRDSENLR